MLSQIRQNKSRQEFPPLLGEYISLAKAEPLHCTNNAWGAIFELLLQEAFDRTRLPSTMKLLQQMPEGCVLVRFVRALKKKVGAHRLHKKLRKHLSGEDTHNKRFTYRFTGRDSRDLCRGFHHLVTTLEKGADDFRVHAIVLAAKQLREVTALMSRVHVTPDELATLKASCKVFFNTMALFFGHVTPTTWTIGHAVPVHTQQLFDEFGFGLGLNSMQGREAKHQAVLHYCVNAMPNDRWDTAFRHEYMSLLWLPKHDPSSYKYAHTNFRWSPPSLELPTTCSCGRDKLEQDESCMMCASRCFHLVKKSADEGRIADGLFPRRRG